MQEWSGHCFRTGLRPFNLRSTRALVTVMSKHLSSYCVDFPDIFKIENSLNFRHSYS